MRIALESEGLVPRNPSGIARYTVNLGRELRALEPETHLVLPASRFFKRGRVAKNGVSDPTWVIGGIWPPKAFDILHITSGKFMSVPGVPRTTKIITTLHDLWDLHQGPQAATRAMLDRDRFIRAVEMADGVICISQSTMNDLKRFLPHVTAPATVIHHGVSADFSRRQPEAIAETTRRLAIAHDPYLLYFGHFHSRKNVEGLLAGYARVPQAPPLVLAGNPDAGRRAAITQEIRRLGIAESRVTQIGYVNDSDLSSLISGALGVIFVPFFEGFGLPLLEAYRCGANVVCADNSSLTELAHAQSPMVDAQDPDSIARGITDLLAAPTTDQLRQELIAHAQTFTWTRCAQQSLAFYQSIIGTAGITTH